MALPAEQAAGTVIVMQPTAQLISRASFPGARHLINNRGRALRSAAGVRVPMAVQGRLFVYDLETLLSGDVRPVAEFPLPAAGFQHSASVTPDLSTAVFSIARSQTAVQAIDPAGGVRWEWRHEYSEGSSLLTADGRQVWAVVAARDRRSRDWTSEWVVLDAADGRLLDRAPLPWRADEDDLVAHPDGRHVGLCRVQEDRCAVFWGRYDADGGLQVWEFSSADEIIIGIDPTGRLAVLTGVDGQFIRLRAFPHGAVGSGVSAAEAGQHRWYQYAGFVDPTTLIASSSATVDMTGTDASHWLIAAPVPEMGEYAPHIAPDIARGTLRGTVSYPPPIAGYPMAHLWPLGDGTWLTADGNALYRWSLA